MRTETDCRQPGRRYLEKQKKRRKRRKVLLLCFLSMAMIAGIFLIAAEEKESRSRQRSFIRRFMRRNWQGICRQHI